ncbi:XdhC family protein [Streptomyces sp. NPDC017890]|uniref:XdhC family protein n=1 Tax=Streptomyces sp. NPDC017890 TaxID=3365015 RepID=UPI0037A22F53
MPLLRQALGLPVGCVGAVGSRRTHARRPELPREAGVPEDRFALLRSPVGLVLGAHTHHATGLPRPVPQRVQPTGEGQRRRVSTPGRHGSRLYSPPASGSLPW